MPDRIRYAPAVLALVLTGLSIQSAQAQAIAPGPYYALPAWDIVLPSHSRCIILSTMDSAAVLDRETGLVWEREPSNLSHTWPSADAGCREAEIGGRKAWRLPRLEQIQSPLDPAQTAPALPQGHPFLFAPPLPAVGDFRHALVCSGCHAVTGREGGGQHRREHPIGQAAQGLSVPAGQRGAGYQSAAFIVSRGIPGARLCERAVR